MFYSQFILAKKGPLGTIWIAAHLERKLGKNQVADTDIGVSVDSILFPEVPIALRLSSHLLLGVVRIYSRKVNYLFHDCSEALLKVKQAFRSTAVDLPPEESTAPYHSITLPETFDLDDFELPDSALFHGNFVDHHISTRDQITLQDTMDGMVYSTSQFGPDERFGDGDASQIGLDLDEDLFLEKIPSPGHVSVLFGLGEDAEHWTSDQPVMNLSLMDVDDGESLKGIPEFLDGDCRDQIGSNVEVLREADEFSDLHGDDIQTPALNEELPYKHIDGDPEDPDVDVEKCNFTQVPSLDLIESAQAPTPGLREEATPASVQGASSLLRKASLDNYVKGHTPDVTCTSHLESIDTFSKKPLSKENLENETSSAPACSDKLLAALDDLLLECGQERVEISHNRDLCNEMQNPLVDPAHDNVDALARLTDQLGSTGQSDLENVEPKAYSMPQYVNTLNPVAPGENPCSQIPVPQTCSSSIKTNELPLENGNSITNAPDPSSREVEFRLETTRNEASNAGRASGDNCCSPTFRISNLEVPQILEPTSSEVNADTHASNECLGGLASKDVQLVTSKSPTSSDFPAPETFLLAPAGNSDLPNNMEVQPNAGEEANLEGGASLDKSVLLSGKKRHLMEITPILQNADSAKLSGVLRSNRNMDYVPDDDDILASILVGRRKPILKMRPTPELASSKRRRLISRASASKRKVHSDDILVLHGDVIRQQLTNTKDIRRIRRKAPCTLLDIWMIHKYLLEEEIFSEPVFTGISLELTGSINRRYAPTETGFTHVYPKHSTIETSRDGNGVNGVDKPNSVIPNENDDEPKEATVTAVHIGNQPFEPVVYSVGCAPPTDSEAPTDVPLFNSSKEGCLPEVAAMTTDTQESGTILGVEMSVLAAQSGDDNVSTDLGTGSSSADANNGMAETLMNGGSFPSSNHHSVTDNATLYLTDCMAVENDACVVDGTKDNAIDTYEVNYETSVLAEDAFISRDASFLEETTGGISADMVSQNFTQECDDGIKEISNRKLFLPVNDSVEPETHVLTNSSTLGRNVKPSIPDLLEESGGLSSRCIVTDDWARDGQAGSQLEALVDNVVVFEKGMTGEGTPSTGVIYSEWARLAVSSSQLNMDMQCEPTNGENLGFQKENQESSRDIEIHIADCAPVGDPDDFDNALAETDTEFLNIDDEADLGEEEDENVPVAKQDQLFDNSGWSSRTRAVAKYLKSLFDNEHGHRRKFVSVDNLLGGKTRKEASRMFFETLVLKTKDYIHVEQQNPFENISIQSRVELMKSEF